VTYTQKAQSCAFSFAFDRNSKMDLTTILMLAVVAVLVLFMIRNNRKRKRDAAEMATKFIPGAEVMTSFGLYGTLVSVDETENTVVLETAPKNTVKLHRQSIARVVTPALEVKVTEKAVATSDAPAFGERDAAHKPASKPATKAPAKKPSAQSAAAKKPVAKPAAKSPTTKPAAKKPAAK
jgi:preprotein translocase subunit YajC